MKKFYLLIFILLILIGCSDNPPEPGSGSAIGDAIGYLPNNGGGYAPPVDVNNNDEVIFYLNGDSFKLTLGQENIMPYITVNQEKGFVYQYGMYSTKNGWKNFEFAEDTWTKNSASKILDIHIDELEEENYILAYSCKKYKKDWKCGCDENGNCGNWMLLTYDVEFAQEEKNITCYDNLDCGNNEEQSYCSDDYSCLMSIQPVCHNPGLPDSYCGIINDSKCDLCSNGCNGGICQFPKINCSNYMVDILNVSNNQGNLDVIYQTIGELDNVMVYKYNINGSIVFEGLECNSLSENCEKNSGDSFSTCQINTGCSYPTFSYYDTIRVEVYGNNCNSTDWMSVTS